VDGPPPCTVTPPFGSCDLRRTLVTTMRPVNVFLFTSPRLLAMLFDVVIFSFLEDLFPPRSVSETDVVSSSSINWGASSLLPLLYLAPLPFSVTMYASRFSEQTTFLRLQFIPTPYCLCAPIPPINRVSAEVFLLGFGVDVLSWRLAAFTVFSVNCVLYSFPFIPLLFFVRLPRPSVGVVPFARPDPCSLLLQGAFLFLGQVTIPSFYVFWTLLPPESSNVSLDGRAFSSRCLKNSPPSLAVSFCF